jgi:hypothetical protein
MISQRCPKLTDLDAHQWKTWEIVQDNHQQINEILLNNQQLQALNLSYRNINLLLPSLCSLSSLTELDISWTEIVDVDFYQLCSSLKNIKILKYDECTKLTCSNIISSLKLLSYTLTYFHTFIFYFPIEQMIDLLST